MYESLDYLLYESSFCFLHIFGTFSGNLMSTGVRKDKTINSTTTTTTTIGARNLEMGNGTLIDHYYGHDNNG